MVEEVRCKVIYSVPKVGPPKFEIFGNPEAEDITNLRIGLGPAFMEYIEKSFKEEKALRDAAAKSVSPEEKSPPPKEKPVPLVQKPIPVSAKKE